MAQQAAAAAAASKKTDSSQSPAPPLPPPPPLLLPSSTVSTLHTSTLKSASQLLVLVLLALLLRLMSIVANCLPPVTSLFFNKMITSLTVVKEKKEIHLRRSRIVTAELEGRFGRGRDQFGRDGGSATGRGKQSKVGRRRRRQQRERAPRKR